jgi:hypothetical protein
MDTGNNRTEEEALTGSDGYLWDRSGEPDPEIKRLETLLGRFQHDGRIPAFPEPVVKKGWRLFPGGMRWFPAVAATAAAFGAIMLAIFLAYRNKPVSPVAISGWDVSRVAGTPRVGANSGSLGQANHLGVGQILETDSQSRARLRAEDIGQIEVDPSTRLRLLTMGAGLKRIALDRGTIHTYIWAPAGQFVVDTPSAMTVDLGCAYTLQVDDSGAGLVRTSLGWVGFKLNGHEAFIPAGAACATRPKVGPGTPYFEDAAAEFRAALARLDFDNSTPQQRNADLALVLAQSRKRDALTLWHLLSRVNDNQRASVYDRLQTIAPSPANVTKQGILHLDQAMLDQWWNELGFDDISVWRHWERSWSGTPQQP